MKINIIYLFLKRIIFVKEFTKNKFKTKKIMLKI